MPRMIWLGAITMAWASRRTCTRPPSTIDLHLPKASTQSATPGSGRRSMEEQMQKRLHEDREHVLHRPFSREIQG